MGCAAFLLAWAPKDAIPKSIHAKLMGLFRLFLVVGGMPGAVEAYAENQSLRRAEEIKHSILSTYKDDFGKYN